LTQKQLAELTKMVDTLRQEPWVQPPDPLPSERRKPGPIYDLAAVQARVTGDTVFLATQRCRTAVGDMDWDADDVAQLIRALTSQDYRKSEWCESSRGVVTDADVYVLYYDPIDECHGDSARHQRYYVKFGFRPNDSRLMLMVFSCHLSQSF
jgi:hypothetical protein